MKGQHYLLRQATTNSSKMFDNFHESLEQEPERAGVENAMRIGVILNGKLPKP